MMITIELTVSETALPGKHVMALIDAGTGYTPFTISESDETDASGNVIKPARQKCLELCARHNWKVTV